MRRAFAWLGVVCSMVAGPFIYTNGMIHYPVSGPDKAVFYRLERPARK